MSISSSIRKAGPYNGDGIATVFPFAFKVFQPSEVLVVQADAQGVETTLTLTTNYTVSLNVDQDANPGGSVTTLTPPAVGFTLTLSSALAIVQSITLTNQGGFYPTVINDALDRVTIIAQEQELKQQRSLSIPISDPSPPPVIPSAIDRAGKYIGFDTAGNTVMTSDPAAGSAAIAQAAQAAASISEHNASAGAISVSTALSGMPTSYLASTDLGFVFDPVIQVINDLGVL